METAKQFVNLTWDDLTIINDALKAVRELDLNSLKYMDLWMICTQLEIRGVKSSTKEQMIKKLVSLHQIKTKYAKIPETPDPASTRKEPQCPYRLLIIVFWTHLLKALPNLGMWLRAQNLMQEKQLKISYFRKVSKNL